MTTVMRPIAATSSPRRERRAPRRVRLGLRGFTLVELLVTVTIIVLVLTALLPAFNRIIESNNYSAGINTVSAALASARASAVSLKRQVGVVFLWDAQREICTIQIVAEGRLEGGVLTSRASGGGTSRYAEILVPLELSAPIELPKGIGVFGLPVASIDRLSPLTDPRVPSDLAWNRPIETGPDVSKWYAGEVINVSNADLNDDILLWLFPRNDPRIYTEFNPQTRIGWDPWPRLFGRTPFPPGYPASVTPDQALLAVRHAHSFFVQFGPDGTFQGSRSSGGADSYNYYLEFPGEPVDLLDSSVPRLPYDNDGVFDPENVGNSAAAGRQVNPEVILRAVDQIAVVDMQRLSEGTGFPKPWLVRAETSLAPRPDWLTGAGGDGVDRIDNRRARAVSRWIDLNAEVISFNRNTGTALRRSAS